GARVLRPRAPVARRTAAGLERFGAGRGRFARLRLLRAHSSAGRASGWQPEGQGFESPWVHFQCLIRTRAREERREDLRELRPADLAILDVDGLEHSVVEATAHRRPRLPVRRVAVAGESDGGAEDVLPAVEVALRRLQL